MHVAAGLHGVGLAPVCALSARLVADVKRDGVHYRMHFVRGHPTAGLENHGACEGSGTTIHFVPDDEIFTKRDFDLDLIKNHLQDLAYLNPELQLSFQGDRLDGGDGLGTYCSRLCGDRERLAQHPLRLRGRHEKVDVDAALVWAASGAAELRSFVSQSLTRDGGTHVEGFWEGMRAAFQDLDTKGLIADMPTDRFRRAMSEGLVAIVHAGLYAPEFESPTKDRLRNPEARSAVAHVVHEGLMVYLIQYHRLREELFARLLGS